MQLLISTTTYYHHFKLAGQAGHHSCTLPVSGIPCDACTELLSKHQVTRQLLLRSCLSLSSCRPFPYLSRCGFSFFQDSFLLSCYPSALSFFLLKCFRSSSILLYRVRGDTFSLDAICLLGSPCLYSIRY